MFIFGKEILLKCSCCGYEICHSSCRASQRREALLYILHRGTVPIEIIDGQCNTCNQINVYDGLDAVFFVGQKPYLCVRTHERMDLRHMRNW